MDVLVIGGNRFVGWLLGFRLLAAGHKVTLLNRGRLADPFGGRVDRLVGDRTSRGFDRALQGRRFDAVVDLAAFTGDDGRRAAQLFAGCGHYVMVSTGPGLPRARGLPAAGARGGLRWPGDGAAVGRGRRLGLGVRHRQARLRGRAARGARGGAASPRRASGSRW